MTSGSSVEIVLTDAAPPSARDAIARGLMAFNVRMLGPADARPLAVLLNVPGDTAVVGGLWGRTSFQWLFVELIFVPEERRRGGLGGDLLARAEEEARRRGCRGAWLETLSADACAFYRRKGYEVFGEIADYPEGNARSFLVKRWGV
ncbi:MAG: GNAT family N-acetyltransferase [Alphaproteobacteria bacterium]|nr:GNAT family N-acetyltransferase [Alphaproteobacteria bacterium]